MGYKKQSACLLGAMLYALSASVSGQTVTWKSSCVNVGGVAPAEQLIGKEGQSVQVGNYTCQILGGPLEGGVMTGQTIWHYNRTTGSLVKGAGVTRASAGQAVWENSEAVIKLMVTDGRVSGFTSEGKGRFRVTSGAAAPFEGKPYSFKARSTGPGRFEIETTLD